MIHEAPPNTIMRFNLATCDLLETAPVFEFDLRQYKKETTDDWEEAFLGAIEKRIRYAQHGVVIGLSAGYDSG